MTVNSFTSDGISKQIKHAYKNNNKKKKKKYTIVLDWKNQYFENNYSIKNNLQIQCN